MRSGGQHVRRFFVTGAFARGAMSKKFSRSDALDDISTWSTNDVLYLLQKNGLDDCCKAVAKRQIDGDELLHLTEGKLALWKSDLTRPLIWSLWNFVEQVKKTPEKYVQQKLVQQQNDDHLSDSSWGTDFEDEGEDAADASGVRTAVRTNSDYRDDRRIQDSPRTKIRVEKKPATADSESTYANCDPVQEEENTYANFHDGPVIPTKNVSRLHSQLEKSLAEQLKEQLELRSVNKPVIGPKPETLNSRRINAPKFERKQPQESFLHNPKPKTLAPSSGIQKRMAVPPPPEPKRNTEESHNRSNKPDKALPKPPMTIRNLDLVANLPTKMEESEDEYEAFDEQIIEQNQKKNISRTGSKLSLTSGHQSSVESVYQPPSVTSFDEEEEPYKIYESITETLEDDGHYLSPIQRNASPKIPPPLPSKPPQQSNTPSPPPPPVPRYIENKERSPEKKSATLPHSGSNASLSAERATRPLPPPPDRLSYIDKPWFHNVTREQANALIKDQGSYATPQDGYFLLRPSTTNVNNPLALVLWYKDRVYNVPVRKRPDNRYALGSAKVNEQSFTSVEEIVSFYMKEELVLHTGGVQTGSTKLTETPPK